MIISPVTKTN